MIGDRIREARLRSGHTQESLAEVLNITIRQISRYENNESFPNADSLARLAKVMNVSADYLLGLEPDPAGLTERERKVLAALRSGDKVKAMKAVVDY
jgi:transcriptional regulator with XRE-family HTH domain